MFLLSEVNLSKLSRTVGNKVLTLCQSMSQVVLLPKLAEKIVQQTPPCSSLLYESKVRERDENNFEIRFKNDHFPDTTSVTKKAKIFEEYVLEAAVAVEVKEKEADESELDEGTKSMNNDLKDLILNVCLFEYE